MKYLVVTGVLLGLIIFAFVLGQSGMITLNPNFSPVAYSTETTISPSFYTMRFEMSDGAICYVLTNEDRASGIESLNQLLPLGCLK